MTQSRASICVGRPVHQFLAAGQKGVTNVPVGQRERRYAAIMRLFAACESDATEQPVQVLHFT